MKQIEIIQYEGEEPRPRAKNEVIDSSKTLLLQRMCDCASEPEPLFDSKTQKTVFVQRLIDTVWTSTFEVVELTSEEQELKRVSEIKRKAESLILDIAPEYKQRNILARALELSEIVDKTPEQQEEVRQIYALWGRIKTICETSNQAEIDGIWADEIEW